MTEAWRVGPWTSARRPARSMIVSDCLYPLIVNWFSMKDIVFFGDVNQVQIQQDTNNSTMSQSFSNYYMKAQSTLESIMEYEESFSEVFGEETQNANESLNTIKKGIEKQDKTLIQRGYNLFKNALTNVPSGVISNALFAIISNGGF